MVPTKKMRMNTNQLKMKSSAMTKRTSKTTTKIKDEKNRFKTSFGFLLEMGTPLISYKDISYLFTILARYLILNIYHLSRMRAMHKFFESLNYAQFFFALFILGKLFHR